MKVIHLKGRYDRNQKKRGYEETYEFYDEGGHQRWSCEVYGECLKAPTVYQSSDGASQNFRMTAKGKLLNATYYLDDAQGTRFATLTRKGAGFRWKVLGEHDQEMARFIDPVNRKEAFFRELFSALPDGYALVSGEDLIALIQNEKLPATIQPRPGNIIGKMLRKVFESTGLTLRLEPPYSVRMGSAHSYRRSDLAPGARHFGCAAAMKKDRLVFGARHLTRDRRPWPRPKSALGATRCLCPKQL